MNVYEYPVKLKSAILLYLLCIKFNTVSMHNALLLYHFKCEKLPEKFNKKYKMKFIFFVFTEKINMLAYQSG